MQTVKVISQRASSSWLQVDQAKREMVLTGCKASDDQGFSPKSLGTLECHTHLRSEPSYAGMEAGMLRGCGSGSVGVAGDVGVPGMNGFGPGFSSAQKHARNQTRALVLH